ncbi:GP4 protein [Pebjah virus]|uniref:GP4 protein n=1 Tax=Pebjah virus TaxID=1658615 RepID=A0A0G2UIQ8_9NIDO|nr:GP4 protein [Pebjah virus]AKI29949.1 GP4 protein [Pebjah virus]AKI29964.1 GP4 protein [Pebjah virus]
MFSLQRFIALYLFCWVCFLGGVSGTSSTTATSTATSATSKPSSSSCEKTPRCIVCIVNHTVTASSTTFTTGFSPASVWLPACKSAQLAGQTRETLTVNLVDAADYYLTLSYCLAHAINLASTNHTAFFHQDNDTVYLCFDEQHHYLPPQVGFHPGSIAWAAVVVTILVIFRLQSLR